MALGMDCIAQPAVCQRLENQYQTPPMKTVMSCGICSKSATLAKKYFAFVSLFDGTKRVI
jgi:hypothetical protein